MRYDFIVKLNEPAEIDIEDYKQQKITDIVSDPSVRVVFEIKTNIIFNFFTAIGYIKLPKIEWNNKIKKAHFS